MPSIKDVASVAGVSVGTVSNVLNKPSMVSPNTVSKVQLAIEQLGFVRNDAARQLRAGRSRSIGMIVLDVSNPFFTDVARGVEDFAMSQGLTVLLGNSGEDPKKEHSYLELFEEQRVLGLLISPFGNVEDHLSQLKSHGIPSVLVDRQSSDNTFSSVSVDDVSGGKLAVEHLVISGKSKIGFVGGPLAIRQVEDRLAGAREFLKDHKHVDLSVFNTSALTVAEGRRIGQLILKLKEEERPDSLFAANDLVAVGLIQALMIDGTIKIPGDIAIIGFDDIAFAQSAIVPITSVRQPSQLIGETALSILLEEAKQPDLKPRQIVFQPELIVRDSA